MAIQPQVDAYLRHLTIERGVAKNTQLAYRRDLARYIDFLEHKGIAEVGDITELHVAEFSEALNSKYGLVASSVARVMAAVRGVHRFWLLEGIVVNDVATRVKPPKTPKRLPKAISIDQIDTRPLRAVAEEAERIAKRIQTATNIQSSKLLSLAINNLPKGLDGNQIGDRVEIGPAQLVKEDEEERRYVYSAPITVTCYVRNPDEDLVPLVIDAEPELVGGLPLDRSNCIVQGLYLAVPEPASLTGQLVAGVAKIGGATVAASTASRSWTAERDTYVDLAADGTLTYSTVYVDGAPPALADGSLRLGYARADAAGLVSWTPLTASILTFRTAYQIAP